MCTCMFTHAQTFLWMQRSEHPKPTDGLYRSLREKGWPICVSDEQNIKKLYFFVASKMIKVLKVKFWLRWKITESTFTFTFIQKLKFKIHQLHILCLKLAVTFRRIPEFLRMRGLWDKNKGEHKPSELVCSDNKTSIGTNTGIVLCYPECCIGYKLVHDSMQQSNIK